MLAIASAMNSPKPPCRMHRRRRDCCVRLRVSQHSDQTQVCLIARACFSKDSARDFRLSAMHSVSSFVFRSRDDFRPTFPSSIYRQCHDNRSRNSFVRSRRRRIMHGACFTFRDFSQNSHKKRCMSPIDLLDSN